MPMWRKVHLWESGCQRPPAGAGSKVLAALFGRRLTRARRAAALGAYRAVVERPRAPVFYLEGGVPDTLDGRFELLALHAFLVLNRLKRDGAGASADFAQALFDTMFADLDQGLREMGAGDLGVGPRVKTMARGFYGRIAAYERGLGEPEALIGALRRNLFGTVRPSESELAAAAGYVRRQAAALSAVTSETLLAGTVPFAPLELLR